MDYDEAYREGSVPWEIGVPQPALARVLDAGVAGPKVLDAGCGTGNLSIALARRGFEVTGFDISSVAIGQARAKAAAQGLAITFEVRDANHLELASGPFDSIFDCGLLHLLERTEPYLAQLPGLAKPGASVFVLAVSVESGQSFGLTEEFLRTAFAEPQWTGTTVEKIEIAALWDGRDFTHRGYLMRTRRAGTGPG